MEDEGIEKLKQKLFIRNPMGIKVDYEYPINCKEEDKIIDGFPMIPQILETKVDDTIRELMGLVYIRISNSTWCDRIRPVGKDDGTIRLTTNLIRLNQKVPLDRYSLLKIEEIIHNLGGAKYFSKIDFAVTHWDHADI